MNKNIKKLVQRPGVKKKPFGSSDKLICLARITKIKL